MLVLFLSAKALDFQPPQEQPTYQTNQDFIDPTVPSDFEPLEEGYQPDSIENSVLITDQAPIGENIYDSSLYASSSEANSRANELGGRKSQYQKPKSKSHKKSQKEAIINATEIKLNTVYTIGRQKMRYEVSEGVDPSEFFFLEVIGHGELGINFYSSKKDSTPFESGVIEVTSVEGILTVPIDSQFYGSKGFVYEIWNAGEDQEATFDLSISLTDRLSTVFGSRDKIISRFAQFLTISVSMPSDQYLDGKDYRLQFIAQSSLERQQLTGNERFEMLINRNGLIPSQKSYDMIASGNSGTGLIKTVSKSNKHYCTGGECFFTLLITVIDIDYVYFTPSVFMDGMDIPLDHYLYLLEELEVGEKITYSFSIPKQEANWIFSIHPVDGAAEIFINPDSPVTDFSRAKYRAVSKNPENVLITDFEAKKFFFSMEKFFVTFINPDPSNAVVFKFEIVKEKIESFRYLKQNVVETGVVAIGELLNYHLFLPFEHTQNVSIKLNMYSFSGNTDFYFKECLKEEGHCQITENDIIDSEEGSQQEIRISQKFRLDADKEPKGKESSIPINFQCKKDGQAVTTEFPVSSTCLFAIGVRCRESTNPFGSYYRFEVRGNNVHVPLDFDSSRVLTINKNQSTSYAFDLRKMNRKQFLLAGFRVIALTGRFQVYFSRKTPYPSDKDNELVIEVDDVAFSSLKSVEKEGAMNLFDSTIPDYLYMHIVSQTYSVVDIYSYLYAPQNEMVEIQEPVQFNQLMHRKMNEDDIFTVSGKMKHVQNFLITIPLLNDFTEPLLIHLTSDVLGFHICAQIDVVIFDHNQPCHFSSESEILEIPTQSLKINSGRKIGLSIQRDIKGDQPDKNEIDFSITINTHDVESRMKVNAPGKSYTYTSTNKAPTRIEVVLENMHRSAMVSITSDDPLMSAKVFGGSFKAENQIEILDKFKFALNVTAADLFKKTYCGTECSLMLEVITTSQEPSRFTLTYTIDSVPISMKDGGIVYLPSSQGLYLAHEPANNTVPISLSYLCEKTSVVLYGAIFSSNELKIKKVKNLLNEEKFDFKSSIENQNTMVIPRGMLSKDSQQAAIFLIVPKFDIDAPSNFKQMVEIYHSADKIRIDVHSSIAKLEPYKHILGYVGKGDFANYHFSLDHPQDFTVMLSVLSGEADLYLNKNMYNITTTKRYWRKAVNFRSDEIVVKKDSYSDTDGPISFSIGVFGREKAKYSIMVVPEFKNLLSVNFQNLIEMDLVKGEFYYFDFFNRNEKYSTLMFSENSDIEISALNFDERVMSTDFLYLVEDESKYLQKFIFHKGDVPRKNLCDHAVQLKTHVIVRIKAAEDNAHLVLLFYDASKPINVFSERRFTFIQEKDDEHIFNIDLAGDYEHVEVDIKLGFGSIEFWMSDSPERFTDSIKMKSIGQQYFNFTLGQNSKESRVNLFDKLFIKVRSPEFSKFSIYVRPKNKFKEIREFETEIVYQSKIEDQFFFYFVSEKASLSTKTFSLFLEFVNFYGDRPELFFIPNTEMLLDKSSKMLAMPLIDYIEREKGDFHTIEVKPEIRPGYFIIKIKSSPTTKVPIKISMSVNNHRNIEVNGLYKGSVPMKQLSHSYSMFIPSPGEVRLLTESCANLDPDTAIFSNRSNSTVITFDDNYSQGFSYVHIDETTSPKERDYKVLAIPIRRAIIDQPGVFKFSVGRNKRFDTLEIPDLSSHYYLMTEFRPVDKQLFFKDYVQLWDDNENGNQRKFSFRFVDGHKVLKVSAAVPKLKQQLLIDYPSLQKVSIRVQVDLFYEESFQTKLEMCGLAILREIKTVNHSSQKVISASEISQNKDLGSFDFLFESKELEEFSSVENLQIFSSLSATFFDDESEEHHVTLNFKFASSPYFFATISNKSRAMTTSFNLLFITASVIGIISLLALFFYITAKGADQQKISDVKYTYAPTGIQSHTALEMNHRSIN